MLRVAFNEKGVVISGNFKICMFSLLPLNAAWLVRYHALVVFCWVGNTLKLAAVLQNKFLSA